MKIQIVSDLHLDHYSNYRPVLKDIHCPTSDILVIAGDLTSGGFSGGSKSPADYLKEISDIFPLHDIIYVPGNHDFWGTSITEGVNQLKQPIARNVHVLYNESIQYGKYTFVGTTLWFKDDPLNACYPGYPDFDYIKNFRQTLYAENTIAIDWLDKNINKDSIVITHFMSHPIFVAEMYRGDDWNRYFLCDIRNVLEKHLPKIVVCGHTHEGTDETINYGTDSVRYICQPYGYPHERIRRAYKNLIVEV